MKTRIAYLRIPEDLLLRLTACIRRMGFTSRSEYFAACAAATVLGPCTTDTRLDFPTTQWISHMTTTQTDLAARLAETIRTIAHPVIAVKGVEVAFTRTCDIIQNNVFTATGLWPTDTEVLDAFRRYDAANKPELIRCKNRAIAEKNGAVLPPASDPHPQEGCT